MTRLRLDIETYSSVSLTDCGVYKYALSPDFRVLLLAYAFDDDPVQVVDLAQGEKLPARVVNAIAGALPDTVCVAHNAVFERVCLTVHLRREVGFTLQGGWLSAAHWDCTLVRCARAGLPLSLAEAGKALGLEQQKMTEGKALIKKFCMPQRTGALAADASRVLPSDAPDDWATFKAYCLRDVETERAIDRRLDWLDEADPEAIRIERELYAADQRINDRGVLIDTVMASHAARIDAMLKAALVKEARELTGLDNPNSVAQLRNWLEGRLGREYASLRKTDVMDIAASTDDPVVRRVMEIRAQAGKTSNAKYPAMLEAACGDGRARGLLQFYGTRTGRWAGRLVQLQNLPQNHLPDEELDFARRLVREGDLQTLRLCYGDVNDTLSQLIRTALIAPEGKTFVVCDFSAIEARVLAWLAGEQWVLEAFRAGQDIYCATASQMFHVPVEKHGVNAELRQKGKIAVLALGYGGGMAALDKMGGSRLGMTEDEESEVVARWRRANPSITQLWRELEDAAMRTVSLGVECRVRGRLLLRMAGDGTTLLCVLPSGREIAWPCASIGTNRFGSRSISYKGTDQTTGRWTRLETYGGKLTENITQAVARDCLAEVIVRLEDVMKNVPVVFHVHDEVICEVAEDHAEGALEIIKEVFSRQPDWAPGLPLTGAGYITKYYRKD